MVAFGHARNTHKCYTHATHHRALESGGGAEDDDEEGAAVAGGSRRAVESLAPLDHGSMEYAPFAKDFYEEAPELARMTDAEVGVG